MPRSPAQADWCTEHLADPVFRASCLDELVKIHLEAIGKRNAELCRWCMVQRARLERLG